MVLWKKTNALLLAAVLAASLAGCAGAADDIELEVDIADAGNVSVEISSDQTEESSGETEDDGETASTAEVVSELEATISWWTYPIFVQDDGESDGAYEQSLIDAFNEKYPNITVELTLLDYTDGPDTVDALIEAGEGGLPDVLLDEPGRISGYAADGVLQDLADLFSDEVVSDMVSDGILSACTYDGEYVMYPLSGSNYVMAFNKEMLEESGAIDYVNLEGDRAWTTDDFESAIEALYEWGLNAGTLYCSGVAGDYATRAFVTNLYDADLMNEDMTEYTFDSDEAVETLTKLKEWVDAGWMLNGSGSSGSDAVESFVSGENSYCLLWSLAHSISYADALEESGVEVVVVPYPSEDGEPELSYVLNGFCIFDNEDGTKAEAAQYFVDFICNDESVASDAVVRTGEFPVRSSMGGVYEENETASLYESFMSYSGTYYNKVTGFEAMRIYWYSMESDVINGESDPGEAAATFVENANLTLEADDDAGEDEEDGDEET